MYIALLAILFLISGNSLAGGSATITLVCDKGKYHNTCLDDTGKTVSVRSYVQENSKYRKVVDTNTTGKYNDRKVEIVIQK